MNHLPRCPGCGAEAHIDKLSIHTCIDTTLGADTTRGLRTSPRILKMSSKNIPALDLHSPHRRRYLRAVIQQFHAYFASYTVAVAGGGLVIRPPLVMGQPSAMVGARKRSLAF